MFRSQDVLSRFVMHFAISRWTSPLALLGSWAFLCSLLATVCRLSYCVSRALASLWLCISLFLPCLSRKQASLSVLINSYTDILPCLQKLTINHSVYLAHRVLLLCLKKQNKKWKKEEETTCICVSFWTHGLFWGSAYSFWADSYQVLNGHIWSAPGVLLSYRTGRWVQRYCDFRTWLHWAVCF